MTVSDYHKMTVSALSIFLKKKEPIKITYRCYKNFNEVNFRNDLSNSLQNFNHETMKYENVHDTFIKVLNILSPTKQMSKFEKYIQ